ncbi:MAG: XRE family transcriptional regulator [Proteobacteria bacterium]|nr:XRE family transcriptional regulator [Pseudomonadota bacterium]
MGYTLKQLGDIIGFSPSGISSIEQNRAEISTRLALAIKKATGVNIDWLLTGEGDPFPGQGVPPRKLKLPSPTLDVSRLADPQLVMNHLDKGAFITVPLVAGEIAASAAGRFVEDQIEDWAVIHSSRRVRAGANLVAVRVKGPSMEPTVPDGAIVALDIDDNQEIAHNGIYAVRVETGDLAIKRVTLEPGRLILTSDNPVEPPRTLEVPEGADNPIVGRVVWMWVESPGRIKPLAIPMVSEPGANYTTANNQQGRNKTT